MEKLNKSDLFSLEEYSINRDSFRKKVLEEKQHRKVYIGEHVVLLFENKNTIQYQIQEMLRIEKIFDAEGIQEELDAYNPLIPDGSNLKAVMLIEYPNVEERKEKLKILKGIERKIWIKVGSHNKVFAIADEDLEREDETKTSAVHYLRYEFSPSMINDWKNDSSIVMGIDHENYQSSETIISSDISSSLSGDFA
ncbi:MAG: DUF3501 family protein [Gammaproteobacteria bacterium]|jgi:hypothetical protein|nr:hypothetical protein [Gammaproteobacteria bacterium]|tara:strand:+ start:1120 stop:1704 length:585 start_codon:yes stop_codon:yes gene_type:complete